MEDSKWEQTHLEELMKELTLEEKAQLSSGGGIYISKEIKRLGIPSVLFLDGGSGVNIRQYLEALYDKGIIRDHVETENNGTEGIATMARFGHIAENINSKENLSEIDQYLLEEFLSYIEALIGEKAYPSCFPSNTLLAATWDRKTVYEDACALGREASAYGIDVLLGTPCINIQRDGRSGRGFENYSEDPYLTAELSVSYMKGIQEQGVAANAKHFAANNQETERMHINEIIPERALYEIYFPAFKACVKNGVESIMSAYNWINGTPCAMNRWLLKDVLRNEWGFNGFVVSDWRAAYDLKTAVKAGNNLAMPGPREESEILEALKEGTLTKEELDSNIRGLLQKIADMPAVKGRKHKTIDFELSARKAYETAAEGITLLKNRDQILPLPETSRISIWGEGAKVFIESGTGSGHVFTNKTSSLKTCIERIVGEENTYFEKFGEDVDALIAIVSVEGQEGGDKKDLKLKMKDLRMLEKLISYSEKKEIPVILILNISGPVELADFIDQIHACINVYYPGQEGAHATADILFGRVNPSGKLPHTFPRSYRECPSFGNLPGYDEKVFYGEGIYVGYRWYDTRRIRPMFPFGYGLSYTTFSISDICLDKELFDCDKAEEKLTVSAVVQNTGSRRGKEVVQLYIRDVSSTLDKPEKELKGFEKVDLLPGESKRIFFNIGREELSSFDTKLHKWICEPGEFEILLGNSSENIITKARFHASGKNPYGYCGTTPIIKLSMDERAVAIIMKHLKEWITETEFFNMTYFGQRHDLNVVWETMLSKVIDRTHEEKQEIYRKILKDLAGLDPSAAGLQEKFVF